jgi:outer membrane protein assembly factor BamB
MSIALPARSCALLLAAIAATPSSPADWLVWGGPNRDFHVALSAPLADSWPVGGPKKLWERELGEGYSAIAVRGSTLYTMYRRDAAAWQIFTSDQEIVVALDARTGRTEWEFAYDVRFRSDQGSGPHTMPQVSGDLVFTVGATGKLHALRAATGKLVWKRDLSQEFGATTRLFGYSSHPLLYRDRLIVVSGGKGKAVAALEQQSGRVLWTGHTFRTAFSSPLLVKVGGQDQVVVLGAQQICAIDPSTGNMLWVQPLGTDPGAAFAATPLWDPETRTLVFSHHGGTTALRIGTAGSQSTVERLWASSKVRSVFSNLLLTGDMIYMSRGSYGPGFMTSADIKTGQQRWSARGFANANIIQADGKLIILDEDGRLTLARPKSDGSLEILSTANVLSHNAWTVPTLAGTTLYLRDRKIIMALTVGANGTRARPDAAQ